MALRVRADRLRQDIEALGAFGRPPGGTFEDGATRIACSDADGSARAWPAHVGEAILFDDKKRLEDVACHMVRNALSLKKLVYLDGRQAVLYRSWEGCSGPEASSR